MSVELDAIAARVVHNATTPSGPWTLEVYPTLRCNLSCAFCDTTDRHRPPQNELSAARWAAIVTEAAELGAQRLMVLGGGEPLLSEATPTILSTGKALGLTGFLTTNGTRLASLAPMLADIGWDTVHVSVDGACAETHDRLRGQAGSFRHAVRGLCRLRALSRAELGLHTVVTRLNFGELPGVLRLAHSLGCQRVEFDHLIAYRPEQHALALTVEQRQRLPEAVAELNAIAGSLGITTTATGLLSTRGEAPPVSSGVGLKHAPCLKAWHHLTVQSDGKVSPCCVLAGEGDVVRSVADTWANDAFLRTVRAGMLNGQPLPRCRECSSNILRHERAIVERLPA